MHDPTRRVSSAVRGQGETHLVGSGKGWGEVAGYQRVGLAGGCTKKKK